MTGPVVHLDVLDLLNLWLLFLAIIAGLWAAVCRIDRDIAETAELKAEIARLKAESDDLRCGLAGAGDGWEDASETADGYEEALERIADATRIEDARDIARDALGLPYSDWPLIERKVA